MGRSVRILITGGLGFIGINLVRGLAAHTGVSVVAADLLPWDEAMDRFLAPVRAQVLPRRLDVRNAGAVTDLIVAEGITHIVHGAAITPTEAEEARRAAEIIAVNLHGTTHVLAAAADAPEVERVLVISSSGVYGTPAAGSTQLQRETDPLALTNLYAITKYTAELLAARFAVLSGKPMAAVRLPAIYGPMERSLASRRQTSAPGLLMAALHAGRRVNVAGAAVVRDWTYAEDVAEGIWALLNATTWRFPVYNLSIGHAASFSEVVQAYVDVGLKAEWVDAVDQPDIAMHTSHARAPLDISRLQADTDFKPAFSITDGILRWLANTKS